jgi:DNA replication and repair protein RecF
MQLVNLTLHDFRNIEATELQPHRYFNVFCGANAQGKTNLLESVYLLGSLKSFRSARNEELIRHNSSIAGIKGRAKQNNVEHEIRVDISRDGKQARFNGKVVNQPDAYLNCLRPVVFAPEEVSLIKGPPAGRRKLLDRAVFQTETNFLADVHKYDRQLKQRNRLLKDGCDSTEIDPWTEELARTGARIRQARSEYLIRLVPRLTECYRQICGEKEKVDLFYKEQNLDLAALEKNLSQEFNRQKDQERRYGMTLSGPHRDDFDFFIDGRPLKSYGSQGQHRSFILAFKAAQTLDLQQVHGEPPVLLLDDLTGELDQQRQNLFYQFLLSMQTQVFITTTETQPLLDGGIKDGYFFRVENGTFRDDSI